MQKRVEIGMAGKSMGFSYLLWIGRLSNRYGLTGTAFFKEDGSIKVIAEGEEKYLAKFAEKLEKGHLWHDIENFYIDWSDSSGEYHDFRVVEEDR